MKNRLLKKWTLWRVARAGFALVFIVAGAGTGDYIPGCRWGIPTVSCLVKHLCDLCRRSV
jgi:hypothetical protein